MRCSWAQRAVCRHGGEVCVGLPTHPCHGELVCPGHRGTQLTDRVGMLRVVRCRRATIVAWHFGRVVFRCVRCDWFVRGLKFFASP